MPRPRSLAALLASLAILAAALVVSSPSLAAVAFSDGFETGDLSKWTASTPGLDVQTAIVYAGNDAAENTSPVAWASKTLNSGHNDLYVRVWLLVISRRDEFQILRFRSLNGGNILGLSVAGNGHLRTRNYASGAVQTSRKAVHKGWNEIELHGFVHGLTGRVGVWLDGAAARDLSGIRRLGTTPIRRVDLGNGWSGRRYHAVYDEVTVNTKFISDPTIAAEGNIACDPNADPGFNGGNGTANSCHMMATSQLLIRGKYDAVLSLGDNQYICGGRTAYNQSYDPSWGRVFRRIYPVPGDKEYRNTSNAPNGTGCSAPPGTAQGYRSYFANARGPAPGDNGVHSLWYSVNIGAWHIIALNGNCGAVTGSGGCAVGDPEYVWLVNDLNTSTRDCTLVFWHQPRFSSGEHGNLAEYSDFWNTLYSHGVEVVLNAHDHDYERFRPQDPSQTLDIPNGIVEFVVGTGGHSLRPFGTIQPNSAARNIAKFGVLQMKLHPGGWTARFVQDGGPGGNFRDSASGSCH